MSAVFSALLLLQAPPAEAQWHELVTGSEASSYLHAMQLRGGWGGESTALRPYGPRPLARWRGDSVGAHPWAARFTAPSRRVQVLRPMASFTQAVGDFPWSYLDGPIWQGMGMTVAASAGVQLRAGPVTLRVEPVVFRAQNSPFTLDGDTTSLRDAQRPGSIDLPQRFGRAPYQRIDAGHSELRVDLGPVVVGLSSMPRTWGPGMRHALLFTGQGGGMPHLFLGTAEAWRTPVGRLTGQLFYGKASPSGYQPKGTAPDRFVTGILGSWQPRSGRGFEIGGARLYHRFWPESGLGVGDLTTPFGSFFTDLQYYFGGASDNQLLSVFMRWRSEADGVEVYGEFGRNDRSINVRDVMVEPEQNSAWLVGFAKSTRPSGRAFWMFRADVVNGRVGSIARLSRGQAMFYEHSPVTQGHTHRGQLLGTPLLERSGGLEVAADRYGVHGRVGVVLTSRAMPKDHEEGVPADQPRTQWLLEGNAVRFVGASELFARVGMALDVNRVPGRDARMGYVTLGSRVGF